jgi:hypothetical protein
LRGNFIAVSLVVVGTHCVPAFMWKAEHAVNDGHGGQTGIHLGGEEFGPVGKTYPHMERGFG